MTLPNPAGHATFTATATDTNGNTSEFSVCASVSVSPVALSIQLSNKLVTVNWPSNAFRLESSFNLTPPISWQTISNGISNSGALRAFTVTNNPAVTNQFFRLIFP